ncbi:nucleoside hydrolase [Paenibacillus sp. J5C_2022]|uniref:nucleoside hydrolase n=1 Tax=Paenibacillus sp. J5C2022 TaxID=2977129 RepID=UPI0021CF619E|nr:nucleoside hydrolase [Paenibacillus sp. J5C2022]MCU6707878.1 nucleoside hydrolase [Paenibacillus sp. J5C2022]
MTEVIVDTDIGGDIDDLLTLAMAVRSPEIRLAGVTTVGQQPKKRASIARALLALNGMGHIPVAAGAALPLSGQWRYEEPPNQYGDELAHYGTEAEEDGADLMIRLVNAAPGRISVMAIGAMTNVAMAITRSPEFARNVKEIIIMGGEYEAHYKECNIVSDPEAADVLFRSGIPITAAGLEVCLELACDTDEVIATLKGANTEQSRFLAALVDRWKAVGVNRPIIMFDAIPLAILIDRSFVRTEWKRVQVETKGEHTRGMTFSLKPHFGEVQEGVPNVHVCVEVDHKRLMTMFRERVLEETFAGAGVQAVSAAAPRIFEGGEA